MQIRQNSTSNMLNSDSTIDIKKYIRLIKRKKWLITIIFTIVFTISFVSLLQFSPKPKYTTTAILQLNDTRALSGLESRGRQQNESKIAMIMSRQFLSSVVEKQAMAVSFGNDMRYDVVDSLKIDENYTVGKYILEKGENEIKLFYTNPDRTIENKTVFERTMPKDYKISSSGFELYLNKMYWEENDKLVFNLRKKQRAVEFLRQSLVAKFVNPRTQTLLSISYNGSDPEYNTETLNTLVDEFVEKNIDNKKFHTREVLKILTSQLEKAKEDLDITSQELKRFRELNPTVGLAADAANVITGVSVLEGEKIIIEHKKNELESLIAQFGNSPGDDKYNVLNKILSFLEAQGSATVAALSNDFTQYQADRVNIRASYAESHPKVIENQRLLDKIKNDIILTARNQLTSFQNSISRQSTKINRENYKLRMLPTKELKFAELQRKRIVADQVYSSLLIRHNQAKISDAVEVGDIIVLDYAVKPKLQGRFLFIISYVGIAVLIGLVLSLGIVFIGDVFDKTVRTPEELKKIVPFRVVAKIPVIGSENEVTSDIFDGTKRVDPKLVTADYSPTAMGEEYRSLRTQILFSSNQRPIRSLFITSFSPNDGKSLNASNLAITFAQQKIPTLLIDGDLRRGVLHNSFACKKKPGLSDFLYSHAEINDENIQKVIQQTHIPNLYLMSSGIPVPNPSEILGSQRGKEIIKFLSNRFGFVIVDTPPIMVTTDSVVISKYVDVGLFVVRAGKTNIEDAKNKIAEYEDFQERIFGIVLNCAETETFKDSYKYSYYNY